ncbi:peptide-binding protein [Chamaesiphon polymorphus CCALA 037]|uniref:Peptide-binding protein n=1 Tax=Chamaesiphon polymorphus CCALA 037 TaxID=2107692 RepID=A0A2T1FGF3_9CYAN|nr:peptide-binding protein [Chamaesiphon polymorphus CCALA 037]
MASVAIVCSIASSAIAVAPVKAETICKVADPTGTPLNIRSYPGGNVVGKIRNGKRVQIFEITIDDRGKPWANIGSGWVVREFIACYER